MKFNKLLAKRTALTGAIVTPFGLWISGLTKVDEKPQPELQPETVLVPITTIQPILDSPEHIETITTLSDENSYLRVENQEHKDRIDGLEDDLNIEKFRNTQLTEDKKKLQLSVTGLENEKRDLQANVNRLNNERLTMEKKLKLFEDNNPLEYRQGCFISKYPDGDKFNSGLFGLYCMDHGLPDRSGHLQKPLWWSYIARKDSLLEHYLKTTHEQLE